MAKRKRSSPTEPLRRLAEKLDTLRREAERQLESAQTEAAPEPRPRLRVATPAPRRAGTSIAQRAREASSLFDTGREEFLSSLEAQLVRRAAPLLARLDVPRREELEALERRVAALERQLAAATSAKKRPRPPGKKG
jgi:HAMP domain-containing protein